MTRSLVGDPAILIRSMPARAATSLKRITRSAPRGAAVSTRIARQRPMVRMPNRRHTNRVRMPLAAASIALAAVMIVLMPSSASAQRQPFVEHVIAFRSLLFGPYGDEGPRAVEEIDRLSAALAAWDSASRRRPADALAEVDAALKLDPQRRALHTLRGRLLDALGRETEATAAYQRAWDLDRTDPVNAYLAFSAL